jgi:hypothetical protein
MPAPDLPLRDSAGVPVPAPPPRSGGPARWIVLAAVVVVVAALLALWWLGRARPEPVAPAFTAATDAAVTPTRPKSQPVDLPPLDASDEFLRRMVALLSANPTLARLLATQGLVRGATLAIVQIGDGRTPTRPLAPLRTPTRATIRGGAAVGPIDPASYARWNGATAALVSIPPADLAQLYVNVKPLFDEAYRDLGFLEGDFDRAIVKAIETIGATPVSDTAPVLRRRPGYLEHEDPALKALLPVQRQFLLLGPDNGRQVVRWLREVASSLAPNVR